MTLGAMRRLCSLRDIMFYVFTITQAELRESAAEKWTALFAEGEDGRSLHCRVAAARVYFRHVIRRELGCRRECDLRNGCARDFQDHYAAESDK